MAASGSDLLERLDRAIRELQAIKTELVAAMPAAVENGADAGDDLAPEQLIDSHAASARFGHPSDSIRKWCREEGLGVRRGGRWLVSIPRLQRRLNGR